MILFFSRYLTPIVCLAALAIYWFLLPAIERVLRRFLRPRFPSLAGISLDGLRLVFLAVLSLGALATLHPIFVVVALAITLVAQRLVAMIAARRISLRNGLSAAIALAVVTLALGKYGQAMARAVWGGGDPIVSHLLMPLGISYFVFRLLQYVFDHARGVLTDNSYLRLATFLFFLPTYPAGPLETYQGFYGKRSLSFDRLLFYKGIRRIALGYFVKVFVVDFLIHMLFGSLMTEVNRRGYHPGSADALRPISFVIVAFLRAYADLWAYTSLAIGFSALFGFRIMENFDRPLIRRNLGEFWRCWHISLSSWCRNNVYFPIYGATRKPWLGLYASMLTMGLWHYVGLNWTAWGLYHGTGLVTVSWFQRRRKARRKALKKLGKKGWGGHWLVTPFPYVMTFLYVAAGYSFVSAETPRLALRIFIWCWIGPFVWLKHHVM